MNSVPTKPKEIAAVHPAGQAPRLLASYSRSKQVCTDPYSVNSFFKRAYKKQSNKHVLQAVLSRPHKGGSQVRDETRLASSRVQVC
jgi:hypothetical protein